MKTIHELYTINSIESNIAEDFFFSDFGTKESDGNYAPEILDELSNSPINQQKMEFHEGQVSKLVGILFCRPDTSLGKEEIVGSLGYFHVRSGNVMNIYCAGYGANLSVDLYPNQAPVSKVGDNEWLYSDSAFNDLRKVVESNTGWQFSGETDLLLLSARRKGNEGSSLDFAQAIVCNLEAMKKDGAISSVRAFFEQLFQFTERYRGKDPVNKLSNQAGSGQLGKALVNGVLNLLPEPAKEMYKGAKHFVVRDISKNE